MWRRWRSLCIPPACAVLANCICLLCGLSAHSRAGCDSPCGLHAGAALPTRRAQHPAVSNVGHNRCYGVLSRVCVCVCETMLVDPCPPTPNTSLGSRLQRGYQHWQRVAAFGAPSSSFALLPRHACGSPPLRLSALNCLSCRTGTTRRIASTCDGKRRH